MQDICDLAAKKHRARLAKIQDYWSSISFTVECDNRAFGVSQRVEDRRSRRTEDWGGQERKMVENNMCSTVGSDRVGVDGRLHPNPSIVVDVRVVVVKVDRGMCTESAGLHVRKRIKE